LAVKTVGPIPQLPILGGEKMTTDIYQGTDLQTLDYIITSQFNPGDAMDIRLQLPRWLNAGEVAIIKDYMVANGMEVRSAQMLDANTLQLIMLRPSRPVGYALLPLAVLIIGAIGVVGLGGVLGWQVGSGVKSLLDSIGKMIIPLALVAGGVFILKTWMERKPATR